MWTVKSTVTKKGTRAKYIQPITNRLCQEYGLSIIDVDDEKKERQHESYKEWSEYREGNFVWSDMIKRDLDACILQAKDYEEFLELLSEKGYQIKQGKHLAIKPQGMTRFRRCKSLGDMYCEEAIRDRIVKEDIAFYKSKQDIPKVSIVKCRVKRYRRAGLSGLQKKHYAKLYRVGKLKKSHTVRYGSTGRISVKCTSCRNSICSLQGIISIQQKNLWGR